MVLIERKGADERVTRAASSLPDGRVSSGRRKREKISRNAHVRAFKADRPTSKRIRNGFITIKSTTDLIGPQQSRKNTTLPAMRFVEPRRTHIPV
ncbi:hypothetical protein TNCV_3084031 [Trichonephila clavipes]|nr:hypothetical protein TNCV_3084031 [Trichonephila clavipes]